MHTTQLFIFKTIVFRFTAFCLPTIKTSNLLHCGPAYVSSEARKRLINHPFSAHAEGCLTYLKLLLRTAKHAMPRTLQRE